MISPISSTIGDSKGSIEIEPLARKISDLHKGMDILYRDGNTARLPISLSMVWELEAGYHFLP